MSGIPQTCHPFMHMSIQNIMKKYGILICLLVFIPVMLPAQFDTIFSLNKTTSHFIKDDTIWLTARSGVVKRLCSTDAILQTYTSVNSPIPPYQLVSSVFVDKQHRMWLYLEEKGIAMLDGDQWTYWSQNDAYYVLSAGDRGRIVVDDFGIPWIVAAGCSPMYYKNGQWEQTPNPNFGAFDAFEMKIGTDGEMWAANSYGGIYRHNGTAWEAVVTPTAVISTFALAPGGGFYTCQYFADNTSGVYFYPAVGVDSILIGTLNGLARRMTVSSSGRIWVAGDFPAGIAYFENGQWQYLAENTGITNHFTLSVDTQGRLWDTKDFFGTNMHNGIQWQPIWAGPIGFEGGVAGKDGSLWFGYLNTLSHYYPATGQTEYVYLKPAGKLFEGNLVGLEPGPDGTFYAASQLGELAWYDGNGNFKKSKETSGSSHAWNSYVAMAVDPSDNLYYQGWDVFSDLMRYNARTGQRSTLVEYHNYDPSIPFGETYFFGSDRRGRLWLNTDKGLVTWANGGWKTYFEPSAVLDFPEYMEAGINGIWLYASAGQRLQYFDGKDTASWYMPLDVANGEQIFRLYSDTRNWLWCMTNQSRVLCFRGHDWKIYDADQGTFPFYSMNSIFEDGAGNMWFLNGADIAVRLNIPSGRISGQLFDDKNLDCTIQTGEPGIGGYRLVFDNGQNRIETIADKAGNFSAAIPPGSYTTTVIPFNNLGQSCLSGFTIDVVQNDTIWLQVPVQTTLHTPLMSVRIGTPFTRRCNETTYYVNVCNDGNLAVDSAVVMVQLPPGLSFVRSDMANTVDTAGRIIFTLGQFDFDTCRDFSFVAKVGCDGAVELGQSLCVTAHVAPDTLPGIGNDAWTGGVVVVKGRCAANLVIFEVRNEGLNSTQAPLNYQVVKDEYLQENGMLTLFTNESKEFEYPADGSTWRFSVEQEAGYPLQSASIAIEGCRSGGEERSTGFVTQADNATGSPFEFTDCHEAIGSYDPNDKQSQPKGWGERHQILPGQVLRYNIRFQNTGTDTAFLVVIRDTLDVALEWESFRPELSSHSYHLEKDSVHRAIAFVFEDILLPDSTQNESASHGFVQFTIRPKSSVQLGTKIRNQAFIYFDFNAAVLTNTVQHTVDTGFIRLKPELPTIDQEAQISFVPNPAGQSTWLSFSSYVQEISYLLKLHDSKGRLMRSIAMTESPFLLEKSGLPSGAYQVSIWANGIRIAVGQVVFI